MYDNLTVFSFAWFSWQILN